MREQLSQAGKPFRLVMIACARKRLVFAKTVLQWAQPGPPERPAGKVA